ncbi:hypothetical protein LOTGIDRAFT_175189 [Lottia gigantea]|uniref:Uncharacterized protein n=1 Tax=Lottia gigantea TaxID=225164 RepID=V4ANM9_LOTGI|nr:hypothetical protein LOTGIDRAFT_175189 [Lottia gigantea]ESO95246.1 hypothetical protein LOTGIDRAFT_175189 [Lottia gigantea]
MPSFRRKSSSNLTLHVNPNRSLSQGNRPLLLSRDSDYGSTSLTVTGKSPKGSRTPEPRSRENELIESPAISVTPSVLEDDVFIEPGPSLDYLLDSGATTVEDEREGLENSITSLDRQLSEWATYNKKKSLDKKQLFEYIKCGLLFIFVVVCSVSLFKPDFCLPTNKTQFSF